MFLPIAFHGALPLLSRCTPLAAAALLILGGTTTQADVHFTLETEEGRNDVFVTTDMLCFRSSDGTMVFDGKNDLVRIVDLERGTASEMTRAQIEEMGAMAKKMSAGAPGGMPDLGPGQDVMAQVRKQMEQAMKDLPEDERRAATAEMEKRFGGASPGSGRGVTTYEPMNETKKIGEYECSGHVIKKGEKVLGETWTASLGELGLEAKDLVVFGKMRSFFEAGLKDAPFLSAAVAEFTRMDPSSDGFLGFPVLETRSDRGEGQTTRLVSVKKGPIDAAMFDVGKDLPQEDAFEGMKAMRGR